MEDHDTGAGAPAVGVSRASPTPPGQASPSAGRHHDRHAGPGSRRCRGGRGPAPERQIKKRRKRRRGRKVFARDDNPAAKAPAPAASVAPVTRQPEAAPSPVAAWPQHGRPPMQELPVFAALDLGTNNCRLLVAVPGRPGQFRVIDAFSRIVRLGEGLAANGRLAEAAMDRAVEALKVCGDKLRNRSIGSARLIATEACRSAANGAEFLARVEARDRPDARNHRPPDRGAARRLGLRLAGRARHRRRRAVRHRRRLVRDRADRRQRAALAAARQPHRRLDLAAGRRRVAGREIRRPRSDARDLRAPWSSDVEVAARRLSPGATGSHMCSPWRQNSICSARPAR